MTGAHPVLTRFWLVLVGLAVVGWLAADGGESATIAGTAVLVVAAVKAALVIHGFMEIGRGSENWEWFFLGWLLVVTGMLVVMNLLA